MQDNKGMTIVEIMVSICIIAIVLALLFTLLIQVREEENENNIQSTLIINQSTFISQIEEDIINYGVKAITPCELENANLAPDSIVSGKPYKCIKLVFAADYIKDNVGFIMIYNNYKNYKHEGGKYVGDESSATWSLAYQRGSYESCNNKVPVNNSWKFATSLMKPMPDEMDISDTPYVLYTANAGTNAASVVIPVVNLADEHYDLNLGFTFEGFNNFLCSKGDKKLECHCTGSNCNNTIANYDSSDTNQEKIKEFQCPKG